MNYNYAFNAYDNNAQPGPSTATSVPGAQQQDQSVDPTTAYLYPGWQQHQPYLDPGLLDFTVAPPPLAPASVYGYQQQVPGYNGSAYTGSFDSSAPQLPPAPPAPPAQPALPNDPVYPAAPDVFAPQPPLDLPAFLNWDFLQPPAPAYDAPFDPALALDWQELLQDPGQEHEHYGEHAHAHEPEPAYEDLEETPVSPTPPFSRTAMRSLLYHGIGAHEANYLRKLVTFKCNAKGKLKCPVRGCKRTFGKPKAVIKHLVINSHFCPRCGAALSRNDAVLRHLRNRVCQ